MASRRSSCATSPSTSASSRRQGGIVCQNRAAPRAPVKLMSNRPETARQNHTALEPPPVKTKLAPRALYLMKPLKKTPKNSRGFASGSAASTRHQVCLQIYAAPGRHALSLLISAGRTGAVGWWAGARAYAGRRQCSVIVWGCRLPHEWSGRCRAHISHERAARDFWVL